MKIWLLTTEYPPYFGGGIATYSHMTSELLQSRHHEVTVFVADNHVPDVHVQMEQNLRIVRFPNASGPHLENLGYAPRLSYHYALHAAAMIAREGPPDIIESQDFSGIAAHLLQRKRTLDPLFADVPVIVTSHSPKFLLDSVERAPLYRFPEYWVGEMERFSLSAADGVIVPSRYLRKCLMQELSMINPEVIPNPYIAPKPSSGNLVPRLLYVGRMQYLKGTLVLLETLANMWDRGFAWPLDMIGGDSHYHPRNMSMKKYVEQRYEPYIRRGLLHIHGPVPPSRLPAAYRQAQAVIVPSLFENFPYVVIEAMASGAVVLASEHGGQQEIITDGENGYLFDETSLESQLLKAVAMSPARRQQMVARAGKDVARHTDPESVYQRKMAYFERVRESGRKSRQFPFIRPLGPTPMAPSQSNSLVSIVVPFYNLGTYLFDTIESLAQIQDPALEILVVDDGSTEAMSIAALHQVKQRYPQIEILRKSHEGLAAARNYGARRVRGAFLAFLDADDKVDPRYYRRALDILNAYDNVSFVGAWTQYFGESSALWPTWNPEPPYALYHNPLNTSSLICRTDHFLEYGLNDPEMEYGMEDYESMIRLLSRGCQGVVIPEPYFLYRTRADSMSRGFNADNLNLLYQWVMDKNPDLYAQYQRELILLLNANGPQYLMDNPGWATRVSEEAR